jgi:putative spermidine/putrescine transport system substrate-binding protein
MYDTENTLDARVSRRELLRRGGRGAVGVIAAGSLASFLEACGGGGGSNAAATLPSALGSDGLAGLIKKAQKEGHLNVVGEPPDWANEGPLRDRFAKKYGIQVTSEGEDDSSAEEIQAMKSLKGQGKEPDSFDVSPSLAIVGANQGLMAPYKPATWDSIPPTMRDSAAMWIGPYWGAISFGSNMKVVKTPPKSWDDLKSSAYKGMIALDGDPRSAGDAFGAVMGASLANGGSLDDIEPGIEFFADLKKRGNFIPAGISAANIAKGATPIAVQWDYENLAFKQEFKGNPNFDVSVPGDGVFGNYYCNGVSKFAAHPYAARLWMEWIFSDEGQLNYIGGFSHPARYQDLVKRNKVPQKLADLLPPADQYANVKFPTVKQTNAATKVLQEQWGPKVVS